MNSAQVHLLLNHLPLFGVAFGLLILLYAIFRKSEELKRVALGLLVLAALGAIPAYLSGEPSEELVEEMAGISEGMIEEHEESAEVALVGIEALGLLSLLGLFLSRKAGGSTPQLLVNGIAALALVAFGMIAWTAHLGGQIHHPELRGEFQVIEGNETENDRERGGVSERRKRRESEEEEDEDRD